MVIDCSVAARGTFSDNSSGLILIVTAKLIRFCSADDGAVVRPKHRAEISGPVEGDLNSSAIVLGVHNQILNSEFRILNS